MPETCNGPKTPLPPTSAMADADKTVPSRATVPRRVDNSGDQNVPGPHCTFLCREAWQAIVSALRLSTRQAEVARCALEGKSQKEIAKALRLSIPTIHRHLTRLYEKLAVSSHAELVARLFREHNDFLQRWGPPTGCGLNRSLPKRLE